MGGVASVDERRLLERASELARIDDALSSARSGRGRLVVLEGEPGIGKSRLLLDAREQARAAGMMVMAAGGLEMERDFAFGLALRLLEPALDELDPPRRRQLFAGSAASAEELFTGCVPTAEGQGADHGSALVLALRTLTLRLAAAGRVPLTLIVDDAQWADSSSLRFLAHLASDIGGSPVAMLVAARSGVPDAPSELTRGLIGAFGHDLLRPRPLSDAAVAQVVRGVYPDAADQFWQACARSTGGNPFYLHELLELVRAEGHSADATFDVEAVVPESVLHSVLVRLARLADPAPALAAAAAVLGDGTPLHVVGRLARLDDEAAEAAADTLAAARILRPGDPLVFIHPLIRAAVHADVPALARSRAHRRAADLVRADDGPVETVAAHLVACRPQGDPEVVAMLCQAAERAAARGEHRGAVRLLERALAEPPPSSRRGQVYASLALAQAATGRFDAVAHLTAALGLVDDPVRRVATLRALARLLFARSEFEAAAEAIDRAQEEIGTAEDQTAAQLVADSLAIASVGTTPRPAAVERLSSVLQAAQSGRLPEDAGLLAQLAGAMLAAGRPAQEVVRTGRAALAGLPADDGFYGVITGGPVLALIAVDDFEAAGSAIEQSLVGAQQAGSLIAEGTASHWRSLLRYRRGDLEGAIADAEHTLAICRAGWDMCVGWVAPILAGAEMGRGDLDGAERAVRLGEKLPDDRPERALTYAARGRLALLRNRADLAFSAFSAAGAHAERFGMTQPTVLAWRSWAALAAMAVGRRRDATELAMAELAQARAIGARRTLGVALCAAGTVQAGKEGLRLLEEAAQVLQDSPARLEHARALISLGAGLRRGGHAVASREPLRRGLEIARAAGARPLADYAGDELRAAGGRPSASRRVSERVLSPAEDRVVRLAARGLSTPQIAQTLYLARKTVDWHLGNAFRKLGITSRHDLPGALAGWRREDGSPTLTH